MTVVTLPEQLDTIITRVYSVAHSLDTKGASSSLVKTRLRSLLHDLHEEILMLERTGFAEQFEQAYNAAFDVLSWLTAALRYPGIRRGDLAHAMECISTLRSLTLPY